MTKSQNTKNEQHCIKQNEKSFIQKDLSLTELWQKGELPSGEYYIIDDLGLHTTDRYYPSHGFGAELPQSVLGRVPTFDEYQSKLEENAQLKELLKDAMNVLKMVDTYYGDYDSTKGFLILERIKEVLK